MCGKNTTRTLFAISPPYTVTKLKELTGQGKIFVRPLQRDLNVTRDVHEEDEQVNLIFVRKHMFGTFLFMVQLTTIFGKSRDENRKCLKTQRVN